VALLLDLPDAQVGEVLLVLAPQQRGPVEGLLPRALGLAQALGPPLADDEWHQGLASPMP